MTQTNFPIRLTFLCNNDIIIKKDGVIDVDKIIVPAPAKINLALDIKGNREDGFHEIETIMQSVSLCDYVEIRKNRGGINVHASIKGLPQGPANIAYRAAEMIIQYSGLSTGVDIRIEKKIPVAGGLAGGSSDAAAVLKGINILFGLNIDDTVLLDMAAELGSDVPFCLRGGTVFASGRGEILRELPDLKRVDLVIVNPGIEISTAWVYQEYDRLCEKRELPVRELLALIEDKAEIKWNEGWANVLEDAVLPYYQDIARIKENLKKMGASFVLMTGSGPTVFAVAETQKAVERIKNNWPEKKDFVTTAWTVKKDFFELW